MRWCAHVVVGFVGCLVFAEACHAAGPCAVMISSRPRGAKVTLDGKDVGSTPVTLSGLARGEHRVEMELDGYFPYAKTIKLRPGYNSVDAKLEKRAGAPAPVRKPSTRPKPKPKSDADEKDDGEPAVPKTIDVDCPVCEGGGLMTTMGCPSCNLTGFTTVDAKLGPRPCKKCDGDGRLDINCPTCLGQRQVITPDRRTRKCPRCKGSGKPPCMFCRGKGKIPRPNPERAPYPVVTCEQCDGCGFYIKAKCGRCAGKCEIKTTRGDANGTTWIVTSKCPDCDGAGYRPPKCSNCSGRGTDGAGEWARPCRFCYGTGSVYRNCRACRGAGFVKDRGGL